MLDVVIALENTHVDGDSDMTVRNPSLYDPIMSEQVNVLVSNSDNDTDDNEYISDEGLQLVEPNGDEYEFGNIELEDLVLSEEPQQILQLILQGQVDDFMEEEIIDVDDYADWLKWVSNAEKRKQDMFESTSAEVPVLLQVHKSKERWLSQQL